MSGDRKARCLLCEAEVPYSKSDTTPLLDHLVQEHPDVKVAPFDTCCPPSRKPPRQAKSASQLGSTSRERRQNEQRQKRYRTTLEMWKPGKATVACPACGMEAAPVMRRTRTSSSRTPLGAMCAVGCWPFCLLPLLLLCAEEVQLFCAHCSRYLGSYDPRTGEPKPIRTDESATPKTASAPNVQAGDAR